VCTLFSVGLLTLVPICTQFHSISVLVGAFVAGIIVPREGGLAIALTEKLEDMVAIIFLPLVGSHHVVFAASINSGIVFYPLWPFHESRAPERRWGPLYALWFRSFFY
jgi:hypothetical protein